MQDIIGNQERACQDQANFDSAMKDLECLIDNISEGLADTKEHTSDMEGLETALQKVQVN